MTTDNQFNITSIGWGSELIENMLDRVQQRSKLRFKHIVLTDFDAHILNKKAQRSEVIPIRKVWGDPQTPPDLDLLLSLGMPGVPAEDSKMGCYCSPGCLCKRKAIVSQPR